MATSTIESLNGISCSETVAVSGIYQSIDRSPSGTAHRAMPPISEGIFESLPDGKECLPSDLEDLLASIHLKDINSSTGGTRSLRKEKKKKKDKKEALRKEGKKIPIIPDGDENMIARSHDHSAIANASPIAAHVATTESDFLARKGEKSAGGASIKAEKKAIFDDHLMPQEFHAGIEIGYFFSCSMRMNPHNRNEAYATVEGLSVDVIFIGAVMQNRSVDGDVVVIRFNPPSEWPFLKSVKRKPEAGEDSRKAIYDSHIHREDSVPDSKSPAVGTPSRKGRKVRNTTAAVPPFNPAAQAIKSDQFMTLEQVRAAMESFPDRRPSGCVVAIAELSSRREAVVGVLEIPQKQSASLTDDQSQKGSALLVPCDPRIPKMIVHIRTLPDPVKSRLLRGDASLSQSLLAARFDGWKKTSYLPHAYVRHSLGQAGDIESETAAIVFRYSLHGLDFPTEALECLPSMPWNIPEDEIQRRWDLREERIFTIDPPTARDLDDALSVRKLSNGNLLIGVHIADVSYFVPPGTALDAEAQKRSTSVYLIQRVLPMLPPLLCEQLCSLNPGVDRLAFSVVWEMNPLGAIQRQWIGHTVIRSCCKLSYNHAQAMIDGGPLPAGTLTLHGGYSWQDVADDVLSMNQLAERLRARRFADGAVRLDSCKVLFSLDGDGNPLECRAYSSMASNHLVEEFMLLANMSVARAISCAYPAGALLCKHPQPNSHKMEEFKTLCGRLGVDFDSSSSAAVQASLTALRRDRNMDPVTVEVLLLHATKPMQLAKYFCTGDLPGEEDKWGHYALATPFYTHFTSPIRRYPDLVVHRIMAATLQAEQELVNPDRGSNPGFRAQPGLKTEPGFRADLDLAAEGSGKKEISNRKKKNKLKKATGRGQRTLDDAFRVRARVHPEWEVGCDSGPLLQVFSCQGGQLADSVCKSVEARRAADKSAERHGLLSSDRLSAVANHCNERKLASKYAQEASDKIYLCVMLKRCNGVLSEARVVAIGPKYVSLYVRKFGIERAIFYDDMAGITAEWFETTGVLVLGLALQSEATPPKSLQNRKKRIGGGVDFAAMGPSLELLSDEELKVALNEQWADVEEEGEGELFSRPSTVSAVTGGDGGLNGMANKREEEKVEPGTLPLTLELFSSVPVLVYCVGGDSNPYTPLDIAVKLYLHSYIAPAAESTSLS